MQNIFRKFKNDSDSFKKKLSDFVVYHKKINDERRFINEGKEYINKPNNFDDIKEIHKYIFSFMYKLDDDNNIEIDPFSYNEVKKTNSESIYSKAYPKSFKLIDACNRESLGAGYEYFVGGYYDELNNIVLFGDIYCPKEKPIFLTHFQDFLYSNMIKKNYDYGTIQELKKNAIINFKDDMILEGGFDNFDFNSLLVFLDRFEKEIKDTRVEKLNDIYVNRVFNKILNDWVDVKTIKNKELDPYINFFNYASYYQLFDIIGVVDKYKFDYFKEYPRLLNMNLNKPILIYIRISEDYLKAIKSK